MQPEKYRYLNTWLKVCKVHKTENCFKREIDFESKANNLSISQILNSTINQLKV